MFSERGRPHALGPSRLLEVSDAELAAVNLTGDRFRPEWNYTFRAANREVAG